MTVFREQLWFLARMPESCMKIVHYPHPALRWKSQPLTSIDNQVRKQAEEMLALMYEAKGLGLAANQVAWPYQMTVINPNGDPENKAVEMVLLNPTITDRKGTQEGDEGCLSFPELFQKVRRAKTVTVEYYDLEGKARCVTGSDLLARLLQHEIDHLHGILYIDKMGTFAKLASRGTLQEFERKFRKAQERGEIPPDAVIERTLAAMGAGA
jgi:peptide deformylase